MTKVDVQSTQKSIRRGMLVELSSDYRTARTVRAYLPKQSLFAMSTTAFRQHILQGTAGVELSRMEAICLVLSNLLKQNRGAARPWFEFRYPGQDGRPQSHPLKLEWFAPSKYWVVLLPEECLRTIVKPAQPAAGLGGGEAGWPGLLRKTSREMRQR